MAIILLSKIPSPQRVLLNVIQCIVGAVVLFRMLELSYEGKKLISSNQYLSVMQ